MRVLRSVAGVGAACVACIAVVQPVHSQVPPTQEQVARFRAAAQPGPEHEMLGSLVGEWDLIVRAWPEPGADSTEAVGRGTNRMLLGGRFLEMASTAEFMGVPADAITTFGFDRRSGLFNVISMDTEGTYWVTGAGRRDADGRIVMSGTDDDPLLGHTQIYDVVLRVDSADRYVIEIVFRDEMHTRGGPPFRVVEIIGTRRRS